jgi:hypothetical protein
MPENVNHETPISCPQQASGLYEKKLTSDLHQAPYFPDPQRTFSWKILYKFPYVLWFEDASNADQIFFPKTAF